MDNKTKDILRKLEPIRDKLLAEYYSDEEYRELVLAMGVTAWEWEQLQTGFDDFIARAESYIKHGLANEAIQELKAAQIINPNDLEMHRCFSQAYLQLWKTKGVNKYADLSEKHAKTCLQINSEYDLAVKILAQLKKIKPRPKEYRAGNAPLNQNRLQSEKTTKTSQETTKQNSNIIFSILGAVLVVLFLCYYFIPFGPSHYDEERLYTKEVVSSETVAAEPEELVKEVKNLLTFPFEFDKKGHDNVEFDVRESTYKGKEGNYSYYSSLFTMRGFATINDIEAESMQVLYDLYAGDKVVHTDKGYLSIPDGAQPGDKFPFMFIHGEKDKVLNATKVKIRISRFDKKVAKASYPESPEVETIWRVKQNDQVNFVLKERLSEIKYNPYSKDMLHSFTFLIENKGSQAIKEIKCKFNWYNAQNEVISEDIFNLWSSTNPLLDEGMAVLAPHKVVGLDITEKSVKVAKYTVEILDVKF